MRFLVFQGNLVCFGACLSIRLRDAYISAMSYPAIAQLVERRSVEVAVNLWSLVRFLVAGLFDSSSLGSNPSKLKNVKRFCARITR